MLAATILLAHDAWADGVSLGDVTAAVARAPAAPIATYEIAAAEAATAASGAWTTAPSVSAATNRLTAQVVVGVALPLPVFGTLGAARDEAAARARVVHLEATVELRDLRRRAVLAWIALARADSEVAVRVVAAQQAAELVRLTRGRLDAGAGAEVDVTAAVAAQARATVAVSAGRRAQEATGAELAAIVGWDPTRAIASDGVLPGGSPVALDALRAHLAEHPERAAALSRIAAAEATRAHVATARIPSLALTLQGSFRDPTTPGVDVLAGVTLDLPVFAHVGDQVRAADAGTAVERARLATAEAMLAGDLVAAYRRWQAAGETAAALAKDVVPAQERATQLAEQAYKEGARDLGTALQAERDLAAVRADLATARADLAVAWIELQVAAGVEPGA